jgi:hypothetical protein
MLMSASTNVQPFASIFFLTLASITSGLTGFSEFLKASRAALSDSLNFSQNSCHSSSVFCPSVSSVLSTGGTSELCVITLYIKK